MCARFFCELGGFLNFVRFLPDMVTPTFFLWEITQKFFFLAYGFHILATQKNIFHGPGGPNAHRLKNIQRAQIYIHSRTLTAFKI